MKCRSIVIIVALIALMCGCSRNDTSCYWYDIDDGLRLWNTHLDTLGFHYVWKGESIGGVINGDGVLFKYAGNNLVDSICMHCYYGCFSEKHIRKAIDGSVYIGDYHKRRTGFGVLIKDRDVYVGQYSDGSLSGKANKYHEGVLVYSGYWKKNKFDGYGTYIDENGSVLKGKWKANKLVEADNADTIINTSIGVYRGQMTEKGINGLGTMRFVEGSVYEGEWKDNSPDGFGTMIFSDSSIYKGNWVKGEIIGQGTMAYSNGDIYVGNWENGHFSGKGKYVFAKGGVYEGAWEKGKQEGRGSFSSQTIRSYNGTWKKGLMVGDDTITYINGDKYFGSLVDNMREGNAFYKFSNGNEYHGQFADDTFNGLGVFTFHDGNRYEGEFAYGKIAGEGTLYYYGMEDTVLITAYWNRDAMFPAMASMLFANGDLYEGEIIDGMPTENGMWTNVRFKDKSAIQKANDYYKRHKSTFDKVVKYTAEALIVVECVVAVIPVAGLGAALAVKSVRTGVEITYNATKTVFSGVDLYEAIENSDREDIAVASADLFTDIIKTGLSVVGAKKGADEAKDATQQILITTKDLILAEADPFRYISDKAKFIVKSEESKIYNALINQKTFGRYVEIELYSDKLYHKNMPNDAYAKF